MPFSNRGVSLRPSEQLGIEPATTWLTAETKNGLSRELWSRGPIDHGVDFSSLQSHSCPERTMHVETKFLRLFRAVELGDDIDGWRVCWLGGWDKCHVLFVVMVKRVTGMKPPCRRP